MTWGNSHLPARHAVGAAALVPIVRSLECVGRAPAQVIKERRAGRYHSPFHPALGLLPPPVQICQMSFSSPSPQSLKSFIPVIRPVGQSIHPDSAPLDRTEEDVNFAEKPAPPVPCESDDEDVDRASSVHSSSALPSWLRSLSRKRSFPPEAASLPPSLRRRPTSNLSNHRTDRDDGRGRTA